jgi:Glycosyltransferase family 87
MIEQQAKISFAANAQFTKWHFLLGVLLICCGAGLLSVVFGPDNYWDLRYYHLYNPWAYLHNRYLYDIGPAQEQGFLNPVADLVFYGLISSPLNETPRVIAFIMGAMHGLNAAIILAIICHVIRPPELRERWMLRAAAWLMSVSGAGFISLLGTATNDLTSSLFVLGSLLGVLKVADPANRRGTWLGFAGSGLLGGIGLGLKYTSAFYVPGLAVVAVLAAARRKTAAGLVAFGVAGALGFLAVAGHHLLTLWLDFKNPFFPYLNQIFQSPYYDNIAIRDDRFQPQGFWQLITYPFYWTKTGTYVVSEPALRDWRAAIAYVAVVAGLLALVINHVRKGFRLNNLLARTPGLGLILAFAAVSYFTWALSIAYYRYAVPLEMLTGVITVGVLFWLFEDHRLHVIVAIVALTAGATTTVYPEWGHRPYGDRYVDVHVPQLPKNSIVLIATWEPVAYFIPYAEPSVQYLGIENNYLELTQSNILASEVKLLMRTPGRPKFVLNVDEFDANKLNILLQHFGLRLSPLPCQPISSNLEGHALSLCRVAD